METVNKVYHAASHAVWGDEEEVERKSGEEPVSGETGQGTATDPYDAGNMEEQEETTEGSTEQTSSTPQGNTSTQEKTSSSTKESVDPKSTFDEPASLRTDPSAPSKAPNAAATGSVGDPPVGTGAVYKQQGADKPFDKPSDEQVSHIQARKSAAEGVQSPALGKEESASGGDTATSQRLGEQGTSTQQSNVPGQHETDTGSGLESGGEKYVKSSGFAAEGGDFDATQPGAGREADRLLEHHEEGIHTGEGHTPMADDHPTAQNGHGKQKMVSRMKDKLHIGKHHDVKV